MVLCLQLVDEVCWLKVPAHCGVPGNEEADTLAHEGRLDSPLYLLPAAARGVSVCPDEDDSSSQVQDMLEDFSFLEQVSGLESMEGCLSFNSHSGGEPHDPGGGVGPGKRPCTPHPPAVPSQFLVPGVGVICSHVHATFGEPIPQL